MTAQAGGADPAGQPGAEPSADAIDITPAGQQDTTPDVIDGVALARR